MEDPKVSIIIPIYKAELYIDKCVRSLFEQSFNELEFIFIDDCSPDKSVEILKRLLEEYPTRNNQVRIIRNSTNCGVAHSRQIGLENATGEYVIHCDPDDWVEPSIYEVLYQQAVKNNADMVCCAYYTEYHNDTTISNQDLTLSQEDAVTALLTGKIHGALWNRLIKNSYIKELNQSFKNDILVMEDLLFITPLYMNTTKITYVPIPLYHYRVVSSSITNAPNERVNSSYINVLKIINQEYGRNKRIHDAFLIALAKRSQVYISNQKFYNPDRWRIETREIPLKYYSNKMRISAWLVNHHLDKLNYFLIMLYRILKN